MLLAEGLGPGEHTCELHLRAATLVARWRSSGPRLRIAAIEITDGATLAPAPQRRLRILGYGDSITEGVGVDAHFTTWEDLRPNNALGTWLPIIADALEAEYGQLGTGGQGIGRAVEIPALADAWHLYDDSGQSRLVEGRLQPEPDLILSNMGTNDIEDPSEACLRWCVAVRAAALAGADRAGGSDQRLLAAVPHRRLGARRRAAGDANCHLIDCPEAVFAAPVHGGASPACARRGASAAQRPGRSSRHRHPRRRLTAAGLLLPG